MAPSCPYPPEIRLRNQCRLEHRVSVIGNVANTVTATVSVRFSSCRGDHARRNPAYVTNQLSNSGPVIDIATNTVIATVGLEISPVAHMITPDGDHAYITNSLRQRQ